MYVARETRATVEISDLVGKDTNNGDRARKLLFVFPIL